MLPADPNRRIIEESRLPIKGKAVYMRNFTQLMQYMIIVGPHTISTHGYRDVTTATPSERLRRHIDIAAAP